MAAIDRGDTEAAHRGLREFDSVSIETYEGGASLQWLRDPVECLSKTAASQSGTDRKADEYAAVASAQNGG